MTDQRFKKIRVFRYILILLLIPIVLPVSFIVVMLIVIPCAVWNAIVWSIYWLRFKLFGVPIPPKCPVPPEVLEELKK